MSSKAHLKALSLDLEENLGELGSAMLSFWKSQCNTRGVDSRPFLVFGDGHVSTHEHRASQQSADDLR